MGNRQRILIVDDNPGDIQLLREAIAEAKLSADLHAAENVLKAFTLLRGKLSSPLPNAIVLDLRMPSVDGKTGLMWFKEDPVVRIVPVVIWTSTTSERERTACLQAGATCFTRKPAKFDDHVALARRLVDWIGRGCTSIL